jgi:DNA repair protein RecN (Recombination protein N)
MIKDLIIKNLILIESCDIQFSPHFTIITGETGAGKTAVLHALKLLTGQKLDTSLIRKGQTKGYVQALSELLQEAGISYDEPSLILSREVSIEGKSKSFINERLVSLSFLQKVCSHLLQIIDQHSYHELRSSETQRELVDLFGGLTEDVQRFQQEFEENKRLKEQLSRLEEKGRQKERELVFCQMQLEELESFPLQEGEEEQLFQEYALISRSQEITAKTEQLFDLLSQTSHSSLPQVMQSKQICDSLASVHGSFAEAAGLLQEASVALQEVVHLLRAQLTSFDADPHRLLFLEEKLGIIDRFKKKYGPSIKDWNAYAAVLKEKIEEFEKLDTDLEDTRSFLSQNEEKLTELALDLSQKRKKSAQELAKQLSDEIQSLNMEGAQVKIEVKAHERTSTGEDQIICWLTANKGEHPVSVKESSSGGELSRLLLAIKCILAKKNNTPTIIFDEIDANVGGKTATLIGEKLKRLSTHRQIFCITHFPQVACQAHLHLRVHKEEIGERTVACIQVLTQKQKEQELLRMLGGEKTLSFYN